MCLTLTRPPAFGARRPQQYLTGLAILLASRLIKRFQRIKSDLWPKPSRGKGAGNIGRVPLFAAILIFLVTSCAVDDPNRRAKVGTGAGAVAGAVLGHQVNQKHGRFLGAAVGALAGGVVGDYMDKQQKEFEEKLAEEQRQNALQIERLQDNTLKLSLNSEVSFDFDRADIKPAFQPSLDKLADVLKSYDRTLISVVGHTDNRGSDEYNMKLSQRRAENVLAYLAGRGVPQARLYAEGRGETQPRDTNDTEAGRQINRRVEVFVKPVVEGRELPSPGAPVN